MTALDRRARRYFTEAARSAALEKRRELALAPRDMMAPELFVVRLVPSAAAFAWEIRRFGGIVLKRAETGFASAEQARNAGILVMAALGPV